MHKNIIFGFLMLATLSACQDEDKLQIGDVTTPQLVSDVHEKTIVLSDETSEGAFDSFDWTRADFGFPSAFPQYILEMDFAGNNFQGAVALTETTDLALNTTNAFINQKLIDLGAEPGVASEIEFRVVGSVHKDVVAMSNVLTATITAFEIIRTYPDLFVTGEHNGWKYTDNSVLFSVNGDDIYEGYIYMNNGDKWSGFKMVEEALDAWNPETSYGDVDDSGTSGNLTPETSGWVAKNIYATEGIGVYFIKANIPSLTYSIYKTEWAVTGDFNSWGNTSMSYDENSNTWSLTSDMTAGGFKFIANADWNIVKGDDGMDGVLDKGTDGNNIVIDKDGNYTITMDLSHALYTYSVVKNN